MATGTPTVQLLQNDSTTKTYWCCKPQVVLLTMLADGGDEFNRYMRCNMDFEAIDNAEFHNQDVH